MSSGAPYCIQSVSILDVQEQLADFLLEYFNPDERARQQDEPVQSIAGRVALKRAVCTLTAACFPAVRMSPTSIVIERDGQGAPRVTEVPKALATFLCSAGDRLHVSISHSRTTAVALAILSLRSRA